MRLWKTPSKSGKNDHRIAPVVETDASAAGFLLLFLLRRKNQRNPVRPRLMSSVGFFVDEERLGAAVGVIKRNTSGK